MLRVVRRLLAFVVLVTAGGARAADLPWPPLTTDLSGVLRLDALGDSPALSWRAQLQPAADGSPRLALEITARGLVLHAHATLPPIGAASGTWRLADGSLDLAVWLPVALARAGAAAVPADLAATGALRLAGEGSWRDQEVSGTLTAAIENATAGSVAQNWSASGLTVSADVALAKNLPVARTLRLGIDRFVVAGLTVRRIAADAVGVAGGKLDVRRVEVEMLGGRVALSPFTLDPAAPAIDTTADVVGVALGDLATLLPEALTAATGQIAGRISVRWNAQVGVEPGAGNLLVATDRPATVRLAERPGFLTERIPARFNLLGTSLGPLSRMMSLENPAYETLRRIELGEMPLVVDALEVKLYPDGPDGASARVELSGHPEDPKSAVGKVSFSVNVDGPLSQVLRLGMQKNTSMSVGTGK